MPSDFLTVEQAAARCGCSVSTLNIARSRGTGPAFYRLRGRRIGYRAQDIDTWALAGPFRSTSDYGHAS